MVDDLFRSIIEIIHHSGLLLGQLIPFVLVGAVLGAALQRYRFRKLFQRLKGFPPAPLVIAGALLGAVSPFCTVGTVPVVIGLLGNGIPLGAGIAFLATSSMVNPQMLLIQAATVGPGLSTIQGLAGVGIGIAAGTAVLFGEKRGASVLNPSVWLPREASRQRGRPSFCSLFLGQLEFVLIYMVAGVLVSAVANVALPEIALAKSLGMPATFSVFLGATVSVPIYACGGSNMPVLATLLDKGIPPGVVLAFIIAGPATRIQALIAVKSLINKRALLCYISLVLAVAVVLGMAINVVVSARPCFYGLQ